MKFRKDCCLSMILLIGLFAAPLQAARPMDRKKKPVASSVAQMAHHLESRIYQAANPNSRKHSKNLLDCDPNDINSTNGSANHGFSGAASTAESTGVKPVPVGQPWYWQLEGGCDADKASKAQVVNCDPETGGAETLKQAKAAGKTAICYRSVGTKDRESQNIAHTGKSLPGWEKEKCFDILNPSVRKSIVDDVVSFLTKYKDSCSAFEPDNTDVARNCGNPPGDTPANLAAEKQLIKELSTAVRGMGISMGCKNPHGIVQDVINDCDFAICEECYDEGTELASQYKAFTAQNKGVFVAQYEKPADCNHAIENGFSAAEFNKKLDGSKYQQCPTSGIPTSYLPIPAFSEILRFVWNFDVFHVFSG